VQAGNKRRSALQRDSLDSSIETIQLLTTEESSRSSRSSDAPNPKNSTNDLHVRINNNNGNDGVSQVVENNELHLQMSRPNSELFRNRLANDPPIVQSSYKSMS
jgi:hypothetical protein